MKFNELMKLAADPAGNIELGELVSYLPDTPLDVLEQFYRDHGRNYQFQEQYSEIDISQLKWSLIELNFNDISSVSVFPDFQKWLDTCAMKSCRVASNLNWGFIGHTEQTTLHWEQNATWSRSPIVLEQNNKLHLVEGHSRFGCLKGLVDKGLISKDKTHQVWLGKNV